MCLLMNGGFNLLWLRVNHISVIYVEERKRMCIFKIKGN